MKKITTKGILYIRNIDSEVKRRFKLWCLFNGVSMTKKIEELMNRVTKNDKGRTD